jgi:thioredoxin 1
MQNEEQHGDARPLESGAQLRNELMSTVKITDETFEQAVLQAELPVLVDFWAEWCGPCKQIAPALEQISEELSGLVTIAKLNIEDSPTTPSRYGVRGIPTMMLFRGGQMASMKVGAMPKQKILEWLHESGVQPA